NETVEDQLFKKNLGSEYDVDDEGNAQTDPASTVAGVTINKQEKSLRLGRLTIPNVRVGKMKGTAVYTAEDKTGSYEFRIFKKQHFGTVLYRKPSSKKLEQLARMDCRGIEQPVYDGSNHKVYADPEPQCRMVSYDGLAKDYFEESLGS